MVKKIVERESNVVVGSWGLVGPTKDTRGRKKNFAYASARKGNRDSRQLGPAGPTNIYL